ncbi:MAG: sulfurtransferase [Planctomycetota bacterium]|nr:MAG: sulfurtransferase [Planctomycetota bacterium]
MGTWQRISVEDYHLWRQEGRDHSLIDVREDWEVACAAIPGHRHIAMSHIPDALATLRSMTGPLIIYCHAGIRSAQVASYLSQHDVHKDSLYNLEGGIEAWSCRIDSTVPRY